MSWYFPTAPAAGSTRPCGAYAPEIVTASVAIRNYRPSCAESWFFGRAPMACWVTCPSSKRADGRDAGDAVVHRGGGVVVYVDLDEPHVVTRLGHLFQDRGDPPARHAPGSPEIHDYRPLRAQNVALESRVRYFGYRHALEPPLVSRVVFAEHSSTREAAVSLQPSAISAQEKPKWLTADC